MARGRKTKTSTTSTSSTTRKRGKAPAKESANNHDEESDRDLKQNDSTKTVTVSKSKLCKPAARSGRKTETHSEVKQDGVDTRTKGRSAKVKAVQKLSNMKEKQEMDDEYADSGDEFKADEEDDFISSSDDDFEVSPSSQKQAKLKQKRRSASSFEDRVGKLPGYDLKENQEGYSERKQDKSIVKTEERYTTQASQEAFLSLSESGSSSDEDECMSHSMKGKKLVADKKPIPMSIFDDGVADQVNSVALTEERKEIKTQSLFEIDGCSAVDEEPDGDALTVMHGLNSDENLEVKTEPITSQYFTGSSPSKTAARRGRSSLLAREAPKEDETEPKTEVKMSLSDGDEHKSDDQDNFDEPSSAKPTRKPSGRPSRKTKKPTKADDMSTNSNTAPSTKSRKRGRIPSQLAASEESGATPKGSKTLKEEKQLKQVVRVLPKRRKVTLEVKKLSKSDVELKKSSVRRKMEKDEEEMEVDDGQHALKEEAGEVEDVSSDDSHSDWEAVEDTPLNESGEPTLASQNQNEPDEKSLEIDIDLPGTSSRAKKKKYTWASYFQWQVNKYNKEQRLQLHKAHLVLLIASCFHSNRVCNTAELQCMGLSLVPSEVLSRRPKALNITFITRVLKWFQDCVTISAELKEDISSSLDQVLLSRFGQKQAASERELVHMFVIILRSLGVDVRLIFSLQPMTHKAKLLTKKFKQENANAAVKKGKSPSQNARQTGSGSAATKSPGSSHSDKCNMTEESPSSFPKSETSNPGRSVGVKEEKIGKSNRMQKNQKGASNKQSSKKDVSGTQSSQNNSSNKQSGNNRIASNKQADKNKLSSNNLSSRSDAASNKRSCKNIAATDGQDNKNGTKKTRKTGSIDGGGGGNGKLRGKSTDAEKKLPQRSARAKNTRRRQTASKVTPTKNDADEDEEDGEEDEDSSDDCSDYEEELKKSASKRKTRTPISKKLKRKMDSSMSSFEEVMSSDSDFEVKVVSVTKQQRKPIEMTTGRSKKASKKILSSESEESVIYQGSKNKEVQGSDCWVEVYSSSERRWICVDCVRGHVNKPEMCETYASKPLLYVVAVENDGSMKDVTRRYASKWMTETHKMRADEEWWEDTLRPYLGNKKRDKDEEASLESNLQNKPLPSSVGEYKNHPLYALKRHLLKFEALFPESPAVLGYCRGEAVYARECVHTLHTRETWLKEAKAIRIGEKPYKMVKPRPKWKKGEGMIRTAGATLGVFGEWQIEDYISPPAVDGKVPRNEYGNVELFKPSMLPAGTVHLKIPGLNKVARKLDIDCAPAMMGWDFHAGYTHPVMDGFVVCEEHAEVLVAAWEEDRAEQERKEKEKREIRALKNWKHITKSLLIRERLKTRYQSHEHNSGVAGTSAHPEEGKKTDASPVKASWPKNKMTSFTGDAGNLLPFEKKARTKKR